MREILRKVFYFVLAVLLIIVTFVVSFIGAYKVTVWVTKSPGWVSTLVTLAVFGILVLALILATNNPKFVIYEEEWRDSRY